MEYNTSRKKLILPEYGRNIQKLVEHTKTVEDKDRRNDMAQVIINIMGNMYPHFRDIADFKHKLWDHLSIMAEFELDIDSPYEDPPKEKLRQSPDPVPYNNARITYKHYGKTIEKLIQQAAEFEEGDEKDRLIEIIGNHMKKNYLTWNKDSVSDDVIFDDLEELSERRVKVNRDKINLNDSKEILNKVRKKRNNRKNKNQNSQ